MQGISLDFVQAFKAMNISLFPISLILPLLMQAGVIIIIILAFKRPSKKIRRIDGILCLWLSVGYVFFGIEMWMFLRPINKSFGTATAIGNFAIAAMLVWDALIAKQIKISFPVEKELRIFSILLIVTGLFIYPLIELLSGMTWPNMVLFTAGCPTNTVLIGLLIASLSKGTNKFIFMIVATVAVIIGSHCAWTGIIADWTFFASGVIGWSLLARYWNKPVIESNRNNKGEKKCNYYPSIHYSC